MQTDAFYFRSTAGHNLFGVTHTPQRAPDKVAVSCNPFGDEKQSCYRPFFAFARHLAKSGIASLRFDFMGSGDSEGDASAASISSHIADLRDAVDLVSTHFQTRNIFVIGLRLGASIAALAAERDTRIRGLALLSPVVDGGKYWNDLLRKQQFAALTSGIRAPKKAEVLRELAASGAIEIEAQLLGTRLVEELMAIELSSPLADFEGNVPE